MPRKKSKKKEKPFKCNVCESAFSQENTLRLHLLSHENRPLTCETCFAEFPSLARLQKHSLVQHDATYLPHKKKKSPEPELKPEAIKSEDSINDIVQQENLSVPDGCEKIAEFQVKSEDPMNDIVQQENLSIPEGCEKIAEFQVKSEDPMNNIVQQENFVPASPSNKGSKKIVEIREKSENPKNSIVQQEKSVPAFPSNKDSEKIAEIQKQCYKYIVHKMFACQHCGMSFTKEGNFQRHLLAHDFSQTTLKFRPKYVKRIEALETGSQCINNAIAQQCITPFRAFVCGVCQALRNSRKDLANHMRLHDLDHAPNNKSTKKSESIKGAPCQITEISDFTKSEGVNCSRFIKTTKHENQASQCLRKKTEMSYSKHSPSSETTEVNNDTISHLRKQTGRNNVTPSPLPETTKDEDPTSRCLRKRTAINFSTPPFNRLKFVSPSFETTEDNSDTISHSRKKADHIKGHSAPKPKCEVCEKEFASKKVLNNHLRSHTDERRFLCTVCNKRFKYARNLRVHSITHINERPYKCQVCTKAFKFKWNLKEHALTHKNDPQWKVNYQHYLRQHENEMQLLEHEGNEKHLLQHEEHAAFLCRYCCSEYDSRHLLTEHIVRCNNNPAVRSSIKASVVSSQEVEPFMESSRGIAISMENNPGIEVSMETNPEIMFLIAADSELEPSVEYNDTPEYHVECEPADKNNGGIEPSKYNEEIGPRFEYSQEIAPSMESIQENNNFIESSQEIVTYESSQEIVTYESIVEIESSVEVLDQEFDSVMASS